MPCNVFNDCEMNSRMMWLVGYVIFASVSLICALIFLITDKPFKRRLSEDRLAAVKLAKIAKDAQNNKK